ncbi:oligosaccharide flippase family protein [filamentous cyanobacterium LEGE 11480]|uniref:Oligosaccharide flippase family protein n=1 Tax=Romeriopsis navalis LEGE 11480 TaxID=2777977 RepID=A0A928Z2I4_9CYAN|nr:oligosaccharide flippase family protein [Romeriopsis navalis]MBE9030421.1 oligosaccharide flippase family protein [Romeriopsis navalis LEGE 11480]
MNLKQQVMSGGFYLALRQGIGMAISLGGVLLLTRLIGPENYGLYAGTFGVFWYVQTVFQMGIEVYIVRHEGEESARTHHQAFTLLLLLSVLGVVCAWIGMPLLQQWMKIEGFAQVARMMFLALPIVFLAQVPTALLERRLDYQRVAFIELADQLIYYVVALTLAFQGYGVWSAVIAWWVQQIQGLVLFYWASRYRPQLCWEPALIKEMLTYGVSYSASTWVWCARALVNPLLVGRFAGAEAVGYVALAIRLAEVLGFVKTATWRIALSALAKFQGDRGRLIRAVNEGMGLQVLALGPLVVAFAWVAPWLMPQLFGPKWIPVVAVFPFIACGNLTNALFNMHSSALYVLKHNWAVTLFHLGHVLLFGGAALFLLPRYGFIGYGWAELVAIGSYVIIHHFLVKSVGSPNYGLPFIWWGGFAAALFVYQLGWWTCFGLAIVAFLPATHKKLKEYIVSIRGGKISGSTAC